MGAGAPQPEEGHDDAVPVGDPAVGVREAPQGIAGADRRVADRSPGDGEPVAGEERAGRSRSRRERGYDELLDMATTV